MLSKDVKPSSLVSIKRLAKQMKKAEGIPHHKALDKASRIASFENYKHARSRLENGRGTWMPNQLFFTVYWEDRKQRTNGRETLQTTLSKPFLEVCSKSELRRTPRAEWFRCVAEDHLVVDSVRVSQDEARRLICKAVRTIQFMDGTGLKPPKVSDGFPLGAGERIPRSDHVTDWIDPSSGQLILIDEPYLDPVVDDDRSAWAKHRNWHLEVSSWPGMYFPHQAPLFAATDASTGYDFAALMAKINALPLPVTDENWIGDSVDNHEVFVSPKATTPQDVRRARAKGTIYRYASKNTVPMHWRSERDDRKPNAIMPFETHKRLGLAINAVMDSDDIGSMTWSRLSSLRSELESWLFVEHNEDQYEDVNFIHVYYGGMQSEDPYLSQAQTFDGKVQLLKSVRKQLKRSYPDCAPLRRILKKVDVAISRLKQTPH